MTSRLAGYCPMGCGETLYVVEERDPDGFWGLVTCSNIDCPRPRAVAEILADDATDHIVELTATTWSVKHPLKERLDDQLLHCKLPEMLASLDAPPQAAGTWRVVWMADEWQFTEAQA